jgi:hypothetical protein
MNGARILLLAMATLATGCFHSRRDVVVDPQAIPARNDDHWRVRAVPAHDRGQTPPDAGPPAPRS